MAEIVEQCRQKGHLVLGIRTPAKVLLNPDMNTMANPGDKIVTVGVSRIDAL
jgi:K+/H+ antiporter YhaU regulatory subunit KhtT